MPAVYTCYFGKMCHTVQRDTKVPLACLARLLLQEAYEDGAYIVRQGEPGSTMFVVQSGDVVATHRVTGDVGDAQEVGSPSALCLLNCMMLPSCDTYRWCAIYVCKNEQATCA